MKKIIFCSLFALLFTVLPSITLANQDSTFSKALDERLSSGDSYYDNNSVTILDSVSLKGNVMKVIKKDDPKTEDNELETEEYQSNIIVALVEYQQVRDSIFKFNKSEVFFYDKDNNEFLEASNVLGNPEVESFHTTNSEKSHKELTMISSILVVTLIGMACILTPLLIMIFHNKSQAVQYNT